MSINLSHIYYQSPASHHHLQSNFPILRNRAWKRRKIKKYKLRPLRGLSSTICSSHFDFNYNFDLLQFENLYHGLVSRFASPTYLDLIVPALGLASGAAIYFAQFQKSSATLGNLDGRRRNELIGDWILFSSPTPFNRFVLLRCPSVSFQGSELLEDVNERLVEEDRHFVKLERGGIHATRETEVDEDVEKLVYQRVCVGTDDGGVLSLDWPANLDMEEERGLDTTLLIVPGTTEGSMESDIKVFVLACLRRGVFPVVLNPRGCAGSPITTARLFTAADSDDISTAIKFVNKARPWTTLMGIGWGYGANMLTKYLAEVGEKTPLSAVTCINNPFDLEEAARYSQYRCSLDQKFTSGLKDILRSNKELFQGRAKGFDIENALLATSVRDFEKAISMVSYGFNEITDFYSNSSTRETIGKVKIPVLFIQNDNGAVPFYAIPRSSIAENPFTSLLLCSHLQSGETTCSRSTVFWCQHVSIEWFAAVELGLLKGRHPLLKDVDVTIGPTNGLAMVESRAAKENVKTNKLSRIDNLISSDLTYVNPLRETEENGVATYLSPRLKGKSNGGLNRESIESQPKDSNSLEQSNAIVTGIIEGEVANPDDGNKGKVLQTAKVVMNMLDVTLPDILTEEQKNKVLTAVGKGETLMTALQNAVPADVIEKLTASVSAILQNQDSNLKLDKFPSLGQIPAVISTLSLDNDEKDGGIPRPSSGSGELHTSAAKERVDDIPNGSNTHQSSDDECAGERESDNQVIENDTKSIDSSQAQSKESQRNDIPDFVQEMNDQRNDSEYIDSSSERTTLVADSREDEQEAGGMPELSSGSEGDGGVDNIIPYPNKDEEGSKSETSINVESKTSDSSVDQIKSTPLTPDDKTPSSFSPSDVEVGEKERNDNVKIEESTALSGSTDGGSNLPNFDVSNALNALTGIDDSTQLAVNSVYNVLEEMITQLDEGKDKKQDDKNADDAGRNSEIEIEPTDDVLGDGALASENQLNQNNKLKRLQESGNGPSISSTLSNDIAQSEIINSEDIYTVDPVSFDGDIRDFFQQRDAESVVEEENASKNCLPSGKLALEESSNSANSIPKIISINASSNLYKGPLYEYLQKFFISKMRQSDSLDLDTTTALFLDYIPEEGQWKLLEQTEDTNGLKNGIAPHMEPGGEVDTKLISLVEDTVDGIEPSYVIVDSEKYQDHINGKKTNTPNGRKAGETDFLLFVKGIVLDTLRVQVGRKLSPSDKQEMQPKLAADLDLVANSVCLSISSEQENGNILEKFRTLEEQIARAIYSSFQDTIYLRKVLPVGVVIGSCLASLGLYFHVDNISRDSKSEDALLHEPTIDKTAYDKMDHSQGSDGSVVKEAELLVPESSSNNTVMAGAAAAALGASALLFKQQTAENKSKPNKDIDGHYKGQQNGKAISDRNQNNIVTSFAEKAMSVAAPLVPMKEGGELDHDRLVPMLAELGQKGGMLKLVGKLALLWGGIRGALSLTDKIISFLRLAERPLFQRMLGFVCLVLLLWSPVVVPLLPTLVQGWASHSTSSIAELACIVGLYVSVMLMVTIWGKRIRGYGNPLEQYGLDMNSPFKFQNLVKGITGGMVLVFLIHAGNFFCGFVRPSWPNYLAVKPSNAASWFQTCGRILLVATRGLLTATTVAVVEELLFRSWLPDEIAAEYGYYRGIIISGLAFSLCQRSPFAIPGLWLLSVALAGARQRSKGSLFVPIGLRAGILWSCFIVQTGRILTFETKIPAWLRGSDPFQPFSGVVGFTVSLFLAMILYPKRPFYKKAKRVIKE